MRQFLVIKWRYRRRGELFAAKAILFSRNAFQEINKCREAALLPHMDVIYLTDLVEKSLHCICRRRGTRDEFDITLRQGNSILQRGSLNIDKWSRTERSENM